LELDADIGKVMDAIRAVTPNTIVIVTADNGAWLDAYPDAGTTPFRGEKGSPFEGGWRVPGIRWWPQHIQAGVQFNEMMSHIDAWATLAGMVGLTPPPHDLVGNDGKPIYFDSIDNSPYILGKSPHSARNSWIYIDGEVFNGARVDIGDDPKKPWVHSSNSKQSKLRPLEILESTLSLSPSTWLGDRATELLERIPRARLGHQPLILATI
jgi:Sulfatase